MNDFRGLRFQFPRSVSPDALWDTGACAGAAIIEPTSSYPGYFSVLRPISFQGCGLRRKTDAGRNRIACPCCFC